MHAKRIGPGVWIVGPLGEIEADETVRQNYIRHGLPPPQPRQHDAQTVTPQPQARPLARPTNSQPAS
ncbi:MAG: hypothetical protein FJ276_36890 [Planctomycetes bacterium]|nr:hypothetical protein [Planctomycetota bacterium]